MDKNEEEKEELISRRDAIEYAINIYKSNCAFKYYEIIKMLKELPTKSEVI